LVLGHVAGRARQPLGDGLDDLVPRVAGRVDRVAEADDDLLARHSRADVLLRLVGVAVALLDLVGHLVRAAVLRPAQRADAAGDGRVHVRARAGDDPAGERARVEL